MKQEPTESAERALVGIPAVHGREDVKRVVEYPTERWLAAAPHLPPLTDVPAGIAERLLLLLHYGIDWSDRNWIAARREDYWDDLLPARVRVATYTSGIDLHHWWTTAAIHLSSTPRNTAERTELAALLTANPKPVLQVLRDHTLALTLRTRIVATAVRDHRQRTA